MIEVEAPDGTVIEFPEGTDQGTILGVMRKNYGAEQGPAPSIPEPEQERTWRGRAETVPYQIGQFTGYADEAIAPLAASYTALREQPGAFFGQELRPELAEQIAQAPQSTSQTMEQQRELYPATTIGSNVLGAVGAGAGIAKAIPGVAAGVKALPWWLSAPAVGTPAYSLYESGEAPSGERLEAAVESIPAGVGLSLAGGAAGQYLPKVVGGLAGSAKPMVDRVKNFIRVKSVSPQSATTLTEAARAPAAVSEVPKAYSKVGKALKKDFGKNLDDLMGAYKSGDMSLADLYGARTQSLAEASALFPAGREVAEEALEKKTIGSYDRVLRAVKNNISGVDSYYTTADDIVNAGRAKAAPLYREAAEDVIQDKTIIAAPEVTSALKRAYKLYPTRLKGVQPDTIEALDYAKKILDDDISEAFRAGKNNLGNSRKEIKNALLEVMDSASPAYARARAEASDYLTVQNAMNQGKDAFKTDPELIKKTFANLGSQEKEAFKIGYGKAVRDKLGKVREGSNPFNALLKSPEQQARAKAILSPEEYKNWFTSLKAEDDLFKFRNKVLGGSPTARREEAKELIRSGMEDAITGTPKATFAATLKKMKTGLFEGINDKTAAKISDILYETDPTKKLKIINEISKGKALTPVEQRQVREIYSAIGDEFDILYAPPSAALGTTVTVGGQNQ